MSDSSPGLDALLELEARSVNCALGLPQQKEIRKPWSGIGFRIGNRNLIAEVGDVKEVLYIPPVTTIPGTKTWVKGMANIRGNLMPILDLQDYLGKRAVRMTRHNRIMVINNDDLWAGLMVDEVYGLRHFFEEEKIIEKPVAESAADQKVVEYLTSGFTHDNASWYIFSMKKLAQSRDFLQVAV